MNQAESPMSTPPSTSPAFDPEAPAPVRRGRRRWIVTAAAILFFAVVLWSALRRTGEYQEISHGNHTHYVPWDRDPDVSIDHFPTRPPGPNERILPDGRIVPK